MALLEPHPTKKKNMVSVRGVLHLLHLAPSVPPTPPAGPRRPGAGAGRRRPRARRNPPGATPQGVGVPSQRDWLQTKISEDFLYPLFCRVM